MSSNGADSVASCWGLGIEADMREVGIESVGIGGVAIGPGKPVVCKAKGTSAGVKIWLAVGSAGTLGEDSKLEDMVAKTDMWVGKDCHLLNKDSGEEGTGAGTVKWAGSMKWAGIGGCGSIRVDPVVEATCVGAER